MTEYPLTLGAGLTQEFECTVYTVRNVMAGG